MQISYPNVIFLTDMVDNLVIGFEDSFTPQEPQVSQAGILIISPSQLPGKCIRGRHFQSVKAGITCALHLHCLI